ncbi:hypothetical protein O3M35_007136 [Rhynocoris fuscipes]|uniref:Transmembrane inner ear expressed protein n=1 Tax=Rhynocoris fuscipes TaxID=488301 RepID=A0AAW1DAQ3_9HEMI
MTPKVNLSVMTSTTVDPTSLLIGNDEWLERPSLWNFRLWHVFSMFLGGFLSIVICLCCCIRFRIPRTKQEIEADYIRKKITRKFKKQLTMINNSEMDEMDLKKALDRIRAEFKSDTESIAQSEAAFSVCSGNSNVQTTTANEDRTTSYRKASELGIDIENLIQQRNKGFGCRIAKLIGNVNILRPRKPVPNTDV